MQQPNAAGWQYEPTKGELKQLAKLYEQRRTAGEPAERLAVPDDATSGDASSFDDNHERRLGMCARVTPPVANSRQQAAGGKKYTCPVKLENINYAGSLRRGRFPTVDPKVGPRSSRYASRPRAQEDRRFQPLYVTRVPWPSSCAMLSLSPLCSALAHAECTRSCPSQTNVHSPV